jgi:hypothetical protein
VINRCQSNSNGTAITAVILSTYFPNAQFYTIIISVKMGFRQIKQSVITQQIRPQRESKLASIVVATWSSISIQRTGSFVEWATVNRDKPRRPRLHQQHNEGLYFWSKIIPCSFNGTPMQLFLSWS